MKGGRFVRSQSLPCEHHQHGDDQAGTFRYGRDVDFELHHPLSFLVFKRVRG